MLMKEKTPFDFERFKQEAMAVQGVWKPSQSLCWTLGNNPITQDLKFLKIVQER